jgi:antitoxin component YwqK of YwqJK toxin-antitoxin module
MKQTVLIFFLIVVGCKIAAAQTLIPFKYKSEDDNRLLKENDSLSFYVATGDTANVVAINEETLTYKLVNKKDRKRVVAEGGILAEGEGYLQHGRWVQYHNNRNVAIAGSYLRGMPAGKWEEYYPDGSIKLSFHYAIITDKDGTNTCMSGEYLEYYNNGKIKVGGFYAALRNRAADAQTVEDPVTGNKINKTVYKSVYTPRKTGIWEYYSESGEQEKREEF